MALPDGLWRETVESLPSEVALLDSTGTIRYTNRKWREFELENGLVGERAASLGENYLDVTEAGDDEYARRALDGLCDLLAGERSEFGLEYPCHSPETKRWFRLSARPVEHGGDRHVVIEHLNVTDRKLAELTVSEKSERLEALHRSAQELLQVESPVDAADLAVATIEEVLEMPIVGLWLYDDERKVLEPVATTAEARAVVGDHPTYSGGSSLSWRTFTENETHVFDELSAVPERFNPDTPIRSEISLPLGSHGVLNIGATDAHAFDDIDVTLAEMWAVTVTHVLSRVGRERDLRERERELTRERDRLDQFASLVSHDLRSPLNVATGRLELAAEECDSDHLAAVEHALGRMDRIVEDVLVLAREGDAVSDTEPVRIADLARECWSVVETPRASLRVDTDLAVRADASRLAQVFENLFRNCVEHGSKGNRRAERAGDCVEHSSTSSRPEADDGEEPRSSSNRPQAGDSDASKRPRTDGDIPTNRTESAENGEPAVGVTVGSTEGGFYVEDDGPGIPEEDRETVFQTGYSTSAEGTGLGLAIVRRIVEAHGWRVAATTGTDGGARFEITGVEPVET